MAGQRERTAEYYRERRGSVRDGYHYDQDIPESIRGKYEENQGSNGTESVSCTFSAGATLKEEVENFEKNMIEAAIRDCQGNRTKAMEVLGMSKRTFTERLPIMA